MNNVPFNRKITFTLHSAGRNKLGLVKSVKMATGWGLKESKDWVDSEGSKSFTVYLDDLKLAEFKHELQKYESGVYHISDLEENRNRVLIKLGIGSKEDMAKELAYQDIENWMQNSKTRDVNEIVELIASRYSELSDEYFKNFF
jgi:hypothetical protein